jgi:uncharacterized protein
MSEMLSDQAIRFLCDQNLGRLAKWLRIMGYDTECMTRWDNARVHEAITGGRVVLTRKRSMEGCRNTMVITHDLFFEQIRQLGKHIDLRQHASPFSRCNVCNSILVEVSREEVKGLVPEYVYATQTIFSRCSSCGRIYWKGTHFDSARTLMDSLMGAGGRP